MNTSLCILRRLRQCCATGLLCLYAEDQRYMNIQENSNTYLPVHKFSSCTLPSGSQLSHNCFLVQYDFCLLALYFSVFTSYRIFPNLSLAHLFLYCAFSYCAVSNWASQKQQLLWPPSRANNTGKTQESSAAVAHMCCPHHISGSHISWLVLVEEQTNTSALLQGVGTWILLWPPHRQSNIWGLAY